jgi:hypothetical protein
LLADRIREERAARAPYDREEPGQHEDQHQDRARQRTQRQKPARRAVINAERGRGQPDEHQDERTLDQDAARERRPEDRRQRPGTARALSQSKIDTRHRAHRGHHGEQEHRVGLGETRLDAEQDGHRHQRPRQQGGAARGECKRGPIGQQHRTGCAD